ncbi:MAG: ComF family protein [Castellaniella sp.]|uniref:phosphoribosyltransferase family protein n=1 Tax=Castellaniella sp. TaxID=1955812 RepID=UPI003C70A27D
MLHLSTDRWRAWIPSDCPGCGRRVGGQGLCPDCLARLRPDAARPRCRCCAHPLDDAGRCPDCGPETPAYDRVVAAFDYAGLGRDLVRDYKIRRRLSLARLLADLLAQAVRAAGSAQGPDWIVPVPARRVALHQRGFSPPAEVARLLARSLGLRYRLDGVRRVRDGERQVGRDRALRLQAQAGAFACGATGSLAGRRIAVVDDVLTTGATLQAVARVLKAAGAAQVEGWVLARAVDHRARESPGGRVLQ